MDRRSYRVLKLIPWIIELRDWQSHPRSCEAWPRRHTCKNKARWQYKYGKNNFFRSNTTKLYCTAHLFYDGIFGDMDEEARYNSWWNRWGRKKAAQ